MIEDLMRVVSASLALMVASAAPGQAPDFAGTWRMDVARSESAHQAVPVGPITLVITQTAAELIVETTTAAGRDTAASTETLAYKLDSTENTMAGSSGTLVKTRARWDGPKLVTQTLRTVNGAPVTIQHVYMLGAGGKELTIDKTLTVQHGYQSAGGNNVGTGKDVFVRTSGSTRKQALPAGR